MKIRFEIVTVSIALTSVIIWQTPVMVSVFALAVALLSFDSVVSRKRQDDLAKIEEEISKLKIRIENLTLSNGFKR